MTFSTGVVRVHEGAESWVNCLLQSVVVRAGGLAAYWRNMLDLDLGGTQIEVDLV